VDGGPQKQRGGGEGRRTMHKKERLIANNANKQIQLLLKTHANQDAIEKIEFDTREVLADD